MLRIITLAILMLACFQLTAQSELLDKHQIGIRFLMPNYILPLENIPPNLKGREGFGAGIEFEYQRRIAPNILLGFPLRITGSDAILNDNVDLTQPTMERDVRNFAGFGASFLAILEPIARRSRIDPQLYAGIGIFTQSFNSSLVDLPLGLNLNIRMGENLYFSPKAEYRIALDEDAGEIRDNFQLGFGVHLMLGEDAPKPPPPPVVVDTDGDGIEDSADQCPTEAGPTTTLGCPDTDGDGIADKDDKCPEVAGVSAHMGCPDTDGDGLADPDDKCPEEAGPTSNEGCPIADRDADGVPDAEDKCPDVKGTLALEGCPDNDGDGVANADDRCPDAPGTLANNGCPDTDSDTVVDPDDRCPTEFGPVDNKGCPEIDEKDQETINFAIQNINFETASAVLTADSREVLDRVEDILKRYSAYSLTIGGHTDSVGSADSNMRLSEKRAQSVMEYLLSKGISTERMKAQGFGETVPIADNRYKNGREQNRRVTLDLLVN